MNIDPNIKTIAAEAQEWRQELHKNPGIAYDEKYASELIQTKLTEWGFAGDFETGWGKNPQLIILNLRAKAATALF